MAEELYVGPMCQSCGYPIRHSYDFGREKTGVLNMTYCRFCYWDGKFTEPDITIEEMIDKAAKNYVEIKRMSLQAARELAEKMVPKLKRWAH